MSIINNTPLPHDIVRCGSNATAVVPDPRITPFTPQSSSQTQPTEPPLPTQSPSKTTTPPLPNSNEYSTQYKILVGVGLFFVILLFVGIFWLMTKKRK